MNLEDLQNKTILLFGKPRAFSKEEFISQLKLHHIGIADELSDEVNFIIDGRMMTPYEVNESEKLYTLNKYEFISIDSFEGELAKHLDEDTLLMSLKLSGNKERLKSFLQNSTISERLFFKLLAMYDWAGEDFFENDSNRDVSAAFISRFYENIEQNHNVEYATTGFIHLIKQTKSPELLEQMFALQPLQSNQKMKMHIAMNDFSSKQLLKKLKKDDDYEVKIALSLNKHLPFELIKEFQDDEKLITNIAKNILLNEEYFEFLREHQDALCLNESLKLPMQKELLKIQSQEVFYALALNENISQEVLEILLKSENETIKKALYENPKMPSDILQDAYTQGIYLEQLAKNENTPIEILYQLQLDARYERAVKTNASFGKSIKQENIGWL